MTLNPLIQLAQQMTLAADQAHTSHPEEPSHHISTEHLALEIGLLKEEIITLLGSDPLEWCALADPPSLRDLDSRRMSDEDRHGLAIAPWAGDGVMDAGVHSLVIMARQTRAPHGRRFGTVLWN